MKTWNFSKFHKIIFIFFKKNIWVRSESRACLKALEIRWIVNVFAIFVISYVFIDYMWVFKQNSCPYSNIFRYKFDCGKKFKCFSFSFYNLFRIQIYKNIIVNINILIWEYIFDYSSQNHNIDLRYRKPFQTHQCSNKQNYASSGDILRKLSKHILFK